MEPENKGPIYELFKILSFVCVKQTSPRVTHKNFCLIGKNTDNNHF